MQFPRGCPHLRFSRENDSHGLLLQPPVSAPCHAILNGIMEEEDQEPNHAKTRLLEHLAREVIDERVLDAIKRVDREAFIPEASSHLAYEDIPLPIGEGQTISQPLMVALMTHALAVKETDKVLEIGTGSGYQAAVLSLLAKEVITMERFPVLAKKARTVLPSLQYNNIQVRLASTALGCPEEAPFDAIIVTAGAPRLPRVLLDQVAANGGRLVIPVGSQREQDLLRVERDKEGYMVKSLGPCHFVPLIGPGAWVEGGESAGEVFV